jgi:IS5 family transposase
MSQLIDKIAGIWDRVQGSLFPALEEAGLEMTEKLYQLVALLEVVRIEEFVTGPSPYQVGAKPSDRRCLARAFVAKAFYNATDTKAFRDRLRGDPTLRKVCGWRYRREVPSESTFSRAFGMFAEWGLADTVHEAWTRHFLGGDALALNASTDSTAIEVRETPVTRAKPPVDAAVAESAPPKRKRGRPKKGTPPVPKTPTRLEQQLTQVPEIALLELPTRCDVGGKKNSKGNTDYWVGYKFHVRVDERGLPLVAVTTAASVHDSQVAIPLMKISDRRVTSLYELMDRGYDAAPIWQAALEAGHVAIIDRVKRRGQTRAPEMAPDRAEHYKGRTVVERFNARLKDEFGGRQVRVRGHRKVHAHLMFGLLVIFADQLLRLT